ncbi:MAG: YARHG domain-containing protein [Limnohabitans sp.]|nr:YARHG domain-containing protein [Limnohabitans sp.]
MKLKYLFLLFLALGCKRAIKNEEQVITNQDLINFGAPDITKNTNVITKADLLGFWVGDFEADIPEAEAEKLSKRDSLYYFNTVKRITFAIDKIEGHSIEGHSVLSGNIAKFKGTCSDQEDEFRIVVDELGTSSTNGKFELYIQKNDTTLLGKWVADSKRAVPIHTRKLNLTKRFFKYDPEYELVNSFRNVLKSKMMEEEYEDVDSLGNPIKDTYEEQAYFSTTEAIYKLNPSKEVFTNEQVENLAKADIYILRNLIFARHGYTFRDKQLRSYFEQQSWYIPVKSDIQAELTKVEKKNIALLLRYEKNAKEYYDVFGR